MITGWSIFIEKTIVRKMEDKGHIFYLFVFKSQEKCGHLSTIEVSHNYYLRLTSPSNKL